MATRVLKKVKSAKNLAGKKVSKRSEQSEPHPPQPADDSNLRLRVKWVDQPSPQPQTHPTSHSQPNTSTSSTSKEPIPTTDNNSSEVTPIDIPVTITPDPTEPSGLSTSSSKKVNLKALSSGLASFSKSVAEKAVEGSKTMVTATKNASEFIAEKAEEGSKTVVKATKNASSVIAEMATEGSKTVVSATKVAGMTVAEATKSAGNTLSEKIRGKNTEDKCESPNILPIEEEVTNPAMFGIPLSQTIINEEGTVIADVPLLITEVITVILNRQWYLEEGIFRLSTNLHHMNALKRSYDLRKSVDYTDILDPHLPSCTLKLFLRELPESLFTVELESEWNAIPSLPTVESKKEKVSELLGKLPLVNRRSLEELFSLLCLVAENKDINKMTITNLGIIFVPALGMNSADLFHFMMEKCESIYSKNTIVSNWVAEGGPSRPVIMGGPPCDIPLPPSDNVPPPSDLPLPPSDNVPPPSDLPPEVSAKRLTSDSSDRQEDSSEGSTGYVKNPIVRTTTWAATNPRGQETSPGTNNLQKTKTTNTLQLGSGPSSDQKTIQSHSSPALESYPSTPVNRTRTPLSPPTSWPTRRTTTAVRNMSPVLGNSKLEEHPPTELENKK